MCGIAGIVLKHEGRIDILNTIAGMSEAIAHRGPDGEGFIIATANSVTPALRSSSSQVFIRKDLAYVPQVKLESFSETPFLAFAHRRLSIIDLTDTGHQPMSSAGEKLWITFNGEIYNYVELKKELQEAGFRFISESDTEVILNAYRHWGFSCVTRFNGMWSFCIYDTEKQICFASRDRLGVKPFYYVNTRDHFAFASEQKAFVKSGLIKAEFSYATAHNYLINGLLETEHDNFFEGVKELFPGNNLIYEIKSGEIKTDKYYSVTLSEKNNRLSDNELIGLIEQHLYNAVRIRLRSDVEVGACLSGGIDSSVLCTLIHQILGKGNYCFTSVFKNEAFNEEYFADVVAKDINAKHFKIEPTLEGFEMDVDSLVYSQDAPIWDTSTYAQFKVMELAKSNNIKVVIDGQGADELFAGYHHHFVAKWNNLLSKGNINVLKEIKASRKTIGNPFLFYAKEKIKQRKNVHRSIFNHFFTAEFLNAGKINHSSEYCDTVNEQLLNDIEKTRLKTFLKCEDRCGMWHGVESRTPFSDDVNLIDLAFSFDGNRKIKNGVSKYLLREAGKKVLPPEIYGRYDKKGFETPMKKWILQLKPQMINEIKSAGFDFINSDYLDKVDQNNLTELRMVFKLFILSRWKKVFT